jgi:hypothetical protein
MSDHEFTNIILAVLKEEFGDLAEDVFKQSQLLQYLNLKTRAASRGSKSRGSFGNLYTLYVLIEDYIKHKFHQKKGYDKYAGAKFAEMFTRQRQLPFGAKLQNHHLNHRLNEEFEKFFPTIKFRPILRDHESNRYWINSKLLKVDIAKKTVDIALSILKIINAYVEARRGAFEKFIADCRKWETLDKSSEKNVADFILSLIQPNVDARIFEIVSYAILKNAYSSQVVFFGWTQKDIKQEPLILYKTGRTNANDGGIDFVMRPVGRFFQVTETVDVTKYFLDIDKIQRYPVTFVVKSTDSVERIKEKILQQAAAIYPVQAIIDKYMACIEEVINIPTLVQRFNEVTNSGNAALVLSEIALQSKLEYNYLGGSKIDI